MTIQVHSETINKRYKAENATDFYFTSVLINIQSLYTKASIRQKQK